MTNTLPAPASQPVQQKNGKATTSLVLGIVSLFINPLAIATILGIVFGIMGVRASSTLGSRNKAVIGIVLSVLGFFVGIALFFSIISGLGLAASTASQSLATPAAAQSLDAVPAEDSASTKAPATATKAAAAAESKKPAAKPAPAEYLNALAQAKAYDSTAHLSKKGLMAQLTSQYGGQFPKKAASYAVKHVGADWNKNAVAQAKAYEETAHLSNAGLHDQLTSAYGGQFTDKQADYALKHLND